MTLQAHVTNLGLHFGLEKHATLADAYCQSFRLDALGTASGPPGPLVARGPEYALAHRRRSVDAPLRIPLEVNTTAAFEAAGIGHLLPALCTRSDAAHSFSAWAVGLRWCTEPRLPSGALETASIDSMSSLAAPSAGEPVTSSTRSSPIRSELAVRWRSSQQLAILMNHKAFGAALDLAHEIGGRLAANDPAYRRPPPAEPARAPSPLAPPPPPLHPEALRPLEGMTIRLSVDMAIPAWVTLLHPDDPCSQALVLTARRLLVDGVLKPSSVNEPENAGVPPPPPLTTLGRYSSNA